jgi:hypothetical protein
MKTLFLLASAMVVLFLTAPNKIEAQRRKATKPKQAYVLNESSAKALIQESTQTASYMASPRGILPLMSRSMNDYKTMTADRSSWASVLGYLIKEKVVTQRTYVESYPNLAGTWAATQGYDKYTMELQQAAGSNLITGTCEQQNNLIGSVKSSVDGMVEPNGLVKLEPNSRVSFGHYLPYCLGTVRELHYQYSEQGTSAFLQQLDWGNLLLTGTASGKVTVTTYEYTFSPEVRTSSTEVELGRYQVGEVSNLLLDGETRAHATFAWRVALNRIGLIMVGAGSQPTGNGSAWFAKKPDGTWVLVKLNF